MTLQRFDVLNLPDRPHAAPTELVFDAEAPIKGLTCEIRARAYVLRDTTLSARPGSAERGATTRQILKKITRQALGPGAGRPVGPAAS
jgi:hypothetical protein